MSDSKPEEKKPVEKRSFTQQFMDFLNTFGVIGLAIAFVIGLAITALVTALVNDIINPIIGLVLPAGSLAGQTATATSIYNTTVTFSWGAFANQIIDFLVIALVVFAAYKVLSKRGLVEDKTKKS